MQTATRLTEFHILACAIAEILQDRKVWEYFSYWEESIDARIPRNVEGGCADLLNLHTEEDDTMEEEDAKSNEDKAEVAESEEDAESDEEEAEVAESEGEDSILIRTGGTPIKVYHDEKKDGQAAFTVQGRAKKQNRRSTIWSQEVVEFLVELQDKLEYPLDGGNLRICTLHQRGPHTFYGHPNYRGDRAWMDWALVDWGQEGVCPSHIWCFVEIPEIPLNTYEHGGVKLKQGVYAVTEVAHYSDVDDEGHNSDLFTPLELLVNSRLVQGVEEVEGRQFWMADTEAFVGPCCVIPDIGGDPNAYFQVKNRDLWAKEFVCWLQTTHLDDDMADTDDEN